MKGLIGLVIGMTIGGAIGAVVVKKIVDKDIVVVKGEDGNLYDVPLSELDTEKVYQEIGDVEDIETVNDEDSSIGEGTTPPTNNDTQTSSPQDDNDGDDERNISM